MILVCSKCQGSFENVIICPKCGVPLAFQPVAAVPKPPEPKADVSSFAQSDSCRWGDRPPAGPGGEGVSLPGAPPRRRWHHSPLGRIFSGLLVALGLSYGLLQLCLTVVQVWEKKTGSDVLTPGLGLGLFYGLQALALLAAGMLAGVGRPQGSGYGALVGLVSGGAALAAVLSGALSEMLEPFASNLFAATTPKEPVVLQGVPVHLATLYGLPLAHLLSGALGGFIGSRIWKPPVPPVTAPILIAAPPPPSVGLKTCVVQPQTEPLEKPGMMSGPIAWIRVLIGTGVAIAGGSFATEKIQKAILFISDGALKIENNEQKYVTLSEIFALSILMGGTIAGATTPNGLKQGVVVGIGAGIGMIPFLMGQSDISPKYMLFVLLSAIFLAPMGGWFGSNLLPPLPPPKETMKEGEGDLKTMS